ncbi:MAG: hypothetical protein Q9184_000617 [Pyrenodesmia sp. 2 TL-2023]
MANDEDSPPFILPPSLTSALVSSAPPSTYYIPSFLTLSEQSHLLAKVPSPPPHIPFPILTSNQFPQINAVPLPTWRNLSHRRLQAHPSPLTPSNTLLAATLPAWLQEPVIPRLLSIPMSGHDGENIFSASPHKAPNHCLINEYLPGQGISAHEDGGAYAPIVATVSLGAPIVLDVYRKAEVGEALSEGPAWRILQEPGSLLISMGEMYERCLHGIKGVEVDEGLHGGEGGVVNWGLLGKDWREKIEENGGRLERGLRVSLTFRDVIRVKKLGFLPGGKR